MTEPVPYLRRRAIQVATFAIGGGLALAFAMSGSAHADTVSGQAAPVVNAGVGVANSGGNVAVGNTSDNSSTCAQGAAGVIASNTCASGNSSDGSASITTGNATAVGNQSSTNVDQSVSGDNGSGGLTVAGQAAPVVNAGAGVANSGGNAALGNDSDNTAVTAQGAAGLVASNQGAAGNSSDGTASIHTGNATGIGNSSSTNIGQSVGAGDGSGGLTVAGQFAPVANVGIGVANTGLNAALGNDSDSTSLCFQGALGIIASNICDASNASDGTATITTGNATGIGNRSATTIGQSVGSDPGGLTVVGQLAPTFNGGIGLANSGLNAVLANDSLQNEILAQVALGLVASNVGFAPAWSDGFAAVVSGNGTAIGNESWSTVWQVA